MHVYNGGLIRVKGYRQLIWKSDIEAEMKDA